MLPKQTPSDVPWVRRLLRTASALYAGRWLPAQCPFCHAWPIWQQAGGICAACLSRYAQPQVRCPRCALALRQPQSACPACTRLPSPLRQCVAAVDYGYPWRQAVEAFKFYQQPAWGDAMAQLLLRQPECQTILAQADCLVPVPLAATRLRERGYNQAWELGQALLRHSHLALPYKLQAIERSPRALAQTRLRRQQRLQGAQHLYRRHPKDHTDWTGLHVVLVDDVMTTGATLFSLAQWLQAQGAAQVDALVFARTPLA